MKSVQNKSETSAFTSDAGRPLWAKLSIAVCLVLGVYFGLKGLNASADAAKKPGADRQTASKKLHATPIERITVGHRVLGQNPEVTDAERLDFIEPDADSWQTVRLRMTKSDGGRLDITLLRPNEWFELLDVKAGGTIDLDLPEMGAVGAADVLEIGPCPTIKSGNGNVVTGTFAHQSADVIDLRVSGQSDPIGCTSNHRFWSFDRGEFIEAGQLRIGEQLDTPNGLVSVVSLTPHAATQPVYNIEVLGEHVYRVGQNGLLVHNSYFTDLLKACRKGRIFGFQLHHIISNKNLLTKNHELLALAGFNLQSWRNKIFLPVYSVFHPLRSIHRGRHVADISKKLAGKMDRAVELGKRLGWTKSQYKTRLLEIISEERQALRSGLRALNKNKRPWAQ